MFKRIISYSIIFSMLLLDVASAMRRSNGDETQRTTPLVQRSQPLQQLNDGRDERTSSTPPSELRDSNPDALTPDEGTEGLEGVMNLLRLQFPTALSNDDTEDDLSSSGESSGSLTSGSPSDLPQRASLIDQLNLNLPLGLPLQALEGQDPSSLSASPNDSQASPLSEGNETGDTNSQNNSPRLYEDNTSDVSRPPSPERDSLPANEQKIEEEAPGYSQDQEKNRNILPSGSKEGKGKEKDVEAPRKAKKFLGLGADLLEIESDALTKATLLAIGINGDEGEERQPLFSSKSREFKERVVYGGRDLSINGDEKDWVVLLGGGKEEQRNFSLKNMTSIMGQQRGDLEGGRKVAVIPLVSPQEDPPHLPNKAQVSLRHMATYDIERKPTYGQWGLIALAAIPLALWFTEAMVPVYDGGIIYARDKYSWAAWLKTIQGESTFQDAFFYYIVVGVLPDASVNTVRWCKKSVASLVKGGIEWGKVIGSGAASILPSLIEASYLISFELYAMRKSHTHGVDNQFSIATFALSPALFLYNFCSNTEMFLDMGEDIKAGWRKAKNVWKKTKDWASPFSPEEITKQDMQKSLETLMSTLPSLSPEERDTIFQTLWTAKQTVKETFPDFSEEELKSAYSFFVTRYLLSLADVIEGAEEKVKTWFASTTDSLIWGDLIVGSPIRFFVLEFVVEQFFSLFCPSLVSQVLGWVGATVGFPFQSLLEYKAMKNFFHKFMGTDPADGHASHPMARNTAKGLSFLQGGAMAVPLAVLCLQVCAVWFNSPWWMVMTIPSAASFVFAELTSQVWTYNRSYNQGIATEAIDIHNQIIRPKVFGKDPAPDYALDWSIRLIQRVQSGVGTLPPDVIDALEKSRKIKEDAFASEEDSRSDDDNSGGNGVARSAEYREEERLTLSGKSLKKTFSKSKVKKKQKRKKTHRYFESAGFDEQRGREKKEQEKKRNKRKRGMAVCLMEPC